MTIGIGACSPWVLSALITLPQGPGSLGVGASLWPTCMGSTRVVEGPGREGTCGESFTLRDEPQEYPFDELTT